MSNDEIATCISSIAKILACPRPNLVELRQKENILKKAMFKVDAVDLIHCFREHSLELVLSLQFIERAVKAPKFVLQEAEVIITLLGNLMRECSGLPIVCRQTVSLSAVVCVKSLKPASLVTFLQNLTSDGKLKEGILSEIPCVSPMNDDERAIVSLWANEVFPLIHRNPVHAEHWLPFVDADVIKASGFMDSLTLTHDSEEILVILCRKAGLERHCLAIVNQLLSRMTEDSCILASRLLGEITCELDETTRALFDILKSIFTSHGVRLHARLRIVENTLEFFENNKVVMDRFVFEFLVALGAFPIGIERHTFLPSDASDDETSSAGLHARFMDLRTEIRQLFRSLKLSDELQAAQLDLVRSALSITDWRMCESLLHAFSAQHSRFGALGGSIAVSLMRSFDGSNTHRAAVNSIMVCGTSYFKSIPEADIDFTLSFALDCLCRYETVDESGWFPFRAKQDNSAVVLMQGIATLRRSWNATSFASQLASVIDTIKPKLYYRDPFRQTRIIFVQSVVRLVDDGTDEAGSTLHGLLPIVCDDCEDIATFITACNSHKRLFQSLIFPKLDAFLHINAIGIERIIAIYAESIPCSDIVHSIEQASKSPGFFPLRWIAVAPQIGAHHGAYAVVATSQATTHVRPSEFGQAWFATCLPMVAVSNPDSLMFHVQWIGRLCDGSYSSDTFKSAAQYAIVTVQSMMALTGASELVVKTVRTVTEWLIKSVSTVNSAEAVSCFEAFSVALGPKSLHDILNLVFPNLKSECRILVETLHARDSGKTRRIMKKLAIAIP